MIPKTYIPTRFFKLKTPIIAVSHEQLEALELFRIKLEKGIYTFVESPCLCGATEGRLIATRDRYALPVNTQLCKSCGMLWTNPQMTEESLNKFYEEDYRPIYVGRETSSDSFFAEQILHGETILSYVSSYIEKDRNDRWVVFDVGCGAGGVLVPFQALGFSVSGCDLGNKYLEYGREHGLTLEHGGPEALAPYGPANLIILSHVLEHFKAPLVEIKKMSDLLCADGFLYVELPGVFNIHNTYRDTLLFFQNAHLYHFTLKTLTSSMESAGFDLVSGNEGVCALFRKKKDCHANLRSSQYIKTLNYLRAVELGRLAKISVVRKLLIKIWSFLF